MLKKIRAYAERWAYRSNGKDAVAGANLRLRALIDDGYARAHAIHGAVLLAERDVSPDLIRSLSFIVSSGYLSSWDLELFEAHGIDTALLRSKIIGDFLAGVADEKMYSYRYGSPDSGYVGRGGEADA